MHHDHDQQVANVRRGASCESSPPAAGGRCSEKHVSHACHMHEPGSEPAWRRRAEVRSLGECLRPGPGRGYCWTARLRSNESSCIQESAQTVSGQGYAYNDAVGCRVRNWQCKGAVEFGGVRSVHVMAFIAAMHASESQTCSYHAAGAPRFECVVSNQFRTRNRSLMDREWPKWPQWAWGMHHFFVLFQDVFF